VRISSGDADAIIWFRFLAERALLTREKLSIPLNHVHALLGQKNNQWLFVTENVRP
jgi:hypothetical protein